MYYFGYFAKKTIKHDLVNKFVYSKGAALPELKKIILNYGCKNTEMKLLSSSLLALELITSQKGILTSTKEANISLKIRKGNPTGCKVTLRKARMYKFFSKIACEIIPRLKVIKKLEAEKSAFSYELHDAFSFSELEKHYSLFNSLPNLTVTLVTNCKTKKEFAFILKSLKFSLIKKQI